MADRINLRLRDRVTVQRQSEVDDGYGNSRGEWSPVGTYWADVRVTTGKERIASGALEATALATVRMRDFTESRAITAADRLAFRGETWEIKNRPVRAMRPEGYIEFTCESRG